MARDFHYFPRTFDIPTLPILRTQWENIPYQRFRQAIATEHQYLQFHLFMANSTRHTAIGGTADDETFQLFLSVRAGAIKAALLICGSIVEAALLAHALKRRYQHLAKDSKKRMFGNIIHAWKNDRNGSTEISPFLSSVEELCDIRNHIHLEKIASSEDAFYDSLLTKEQSLLIESLRIIEWLKNISTP